MDGVVRRFICVQILFFLEPFFEERFLRLVRSLNFDSFCHLLKFYTNLDCVYYIIFQFYKFGTLKCA